MQLSTLGVGLQPITYIPQVVGIYQVLHEPMMQRCITVGILVSAVSIEIT
jgi:hypothetical protein